MASSAARVAVRLHCPRAADGRFRCAPRADELSADNSQQRGARVARSTRPAAKRITLYLSYVLRSSPTARRLWSGLPNAASLQTRTWNQHAVTIGVLCTSALSQSVSPMRGCCYGPLGFRDQTTASTLACVSARERSSVTTSHAFRSGALIGPRTNAIAGARRPRDPALITCGYTTWTSSLDFTCSYSGEQRARPRLVIDSRVHA